MVPMLFQMLLLKYIVNIVTIFQSVYLTSPWLSLINYRSPIQSASATIRDSRRQRFPFSRNLGSASSMKTRCVNMCLRESPKNLFSNLVFKPAMFASIISWYQSYLHQWNLPLDMSWLRMRRYFSHLAWFLFCVMCKSFKRVSVLFCF